MRIERNRKRKGEKNRETEVEKRKGEGIYALRLNECVWYRIG